MDLPQLSEYVVALAAAIEEATDAQRAMLEAHIAAPNHQLTATQLAQAAGYSNYGVANIQYGAFAHKVCDALNYSPPPGNSGAPTFTYALAKSIKLPNQDWLWTLHDVVVEAYAAIGAPPELNQEPTGAVYPEEVPEGITYAEGAVIARLVNAKERSPEARTECLNYWGTACSVCDMDAAAAYGVDPSRFVHVHHLQPLSTLTTITQIDPRTDLRPLCPSCHTVLHMTTPPLSISELRSRLRRLRSAV